jgi:hypothetical protein
VGNLAVLDTCDVIDESPRKGVPIPQTQGSASTTQQKKPPLSQKSVNFDHEIMEIGFLIKFD